MRTLLTLPAIALMLATPALAMDNQIHKTTMMKPTKHHAMAGRASTTPAVNRPGDADLRSANKKGGTGGSASSNNGS